MEQIASQQFLLLIIPWFLDKFKPWTAKKAVVQHLYLGRTPPAFTGIRVLRESNDDDHLEYVEKNLLTLKVEEEEQPIATENQEAAAEKNEENEEPQAEEPPPLLNEIKMQSENTGDLLEQLQVKLSSRTRHPIVLLHYSALGMLLETARRAFSVEAMELAEGILLIVESLTMEANESDTGITESVLTVTNEVSGTGEQTKKMVIMFLERLKKSSKQ